LAAGRRKARGPLSLENIMRGLTLCAVVVVALNSPAFAANQKLANPAIDSAAYLRDASAAAAQRQSHRVSEDEFIRLSRLPGAIILDARSRPRYDALHVRGAVHLSYPDITVDSLAQKLPDKNALILIYCNNNFQNAADPFPSKLPAAALNLATYTVLYTYGYRNVYELGPLLDVATTRIPFESTRR
jgi:hypothetical protein